MYPSRNYIFPIASFLIYNIWPMGNIQIYSGAKFSKIYECREI